MFWECLQCCSTVPISKFSIKWADLEGQCLVVREIPAWPVTLHQLRWKALIGSTLQCPAGALLAVMNSSYGLWGIPHSLHWSGRVSSSQDRLSGKSSMAIFSELKFVRNLCSYWRYHPENLRANRGLYSLLINNVLSLWPLYLFSTQPEKYM